nr:TetR/AcrR family transcriptional regulator [Hyphomonas sp. Mor2]
MTKTTNSELIDAIRPLDPSTTRDVLMLTALKEFGVRGISGTSVNRLVKESGEKNTSAIHYHFGSRTGLIKALINYVQDWFDFEREAQLRALERTIDDGRDISIAQVLTAFVQPYQAVLEREPWGLEAIRFIAMIEFDEDKEGRELLAIRATETAKRFLALLRHAAPHLESPQLIRRMKFYTSSVIYAYSSIRHSGTAYYGENEDLKPSERTDFYVRSGIRLFSDGDD